MLVDDTIFRMLKSRFPDETVIADWKQDIAERVVKYLENEGLADEQMKKSGRSRVESTPFVESTSCLP